MNMKYALQDDGAERQHIPGRDGERTVRLEEFLQYFKNADLVRIMETGVPDPIYVGYMSILRQDKEKAGQMKEYMGGKVEKFRVVPEIRHRKWKEKGLMPPLLPEQTPMYNFQDLQMEIFNEIWIDGRMPVDYTTERKMEKVR